VLTAKAAEYATDDRLHNFKAAADLERVTPVEALGGMMAKHTISVYDLIHDYGDGKEIPLELWSEKITDSINYLFLLWALLNEKDKPKTEKGKPDIFLKPHEPAEDNGCKFCDSNIVHTTTVEMARETFNEESQAMEKRYTLANMRFCPMCGRKLNV
jgi:hypothetical protein